MKRTLFVAFWLCTGLLNFSSCDSQEDTVSQGRKAVKEGITEPFNALEGAKDSLKQSEEKSKAALEEIDKELKQ